MGDFCEALNKPTLLERKCFGVHCENIYKRHVSDLRLRRKKKKAFKVNTEEMETKAVTHPLDFYIFSKGTSNLD